MPCVAACQMGGDFCLSGELLASRGGWPNLKGSIHHARVHYPAVSGLQEPELFDDQEQEDDNRASGDVEVLQYVPEAHRPQGNKVRVQRPGPSVQQSSAICFLNPKPWPLNPRFTGA